MGVETFTSEAAFDAAISNPTTYGFTGIAPAIGYSYFPSGLTLGPADFTNPGGAIFVSAAGSNGLESSSSQPGSYGVPFLSSQSTNANGAELLVTDTGTYAIGFDYGSYIFGSDQLSVTLSTGDTFFINLPFDPKTTAFIGFTSSTPITSVSFVDQSGGTVLDVTDFTVGTPVPVPVMLNATHNGHGATTLSGASEPGASVSVFDGAKFIGQATAGNDGNWSLATVVTGNAIHRFTETSTDPAGNTASSAGVTLYTPAANKSLIGGNGNDVLIGRPNDTLTGGNGSDTFVFNPHFGKEVITDFNVNQDTLSFSSSLFATDTASQVLSQTHDSKNGAVIAVHPGETITLTGVTVAQLQAGQQANSDWLNFFEGPPQSGASFTEDSIIQWRAALLSQHIASAFASHGVGEDRPLISSTPEMATTLVANSSGAHHIA